jgi:antitoxin component of MazEF toxin-antitoxin module
MGYPTKVQLIKRAKSSQWYITVPAALARMLDFSQGEVVEWNVEDRKTLLLHRQHVPDSPLTVLTQKKKLRHRSSKKSTVSSRSVKRHS